MGFRLTADSFDLDLKPIPKLIALAVADATKQETMILESSIGYLQWETGLGRSTVEKQLRAWRIAGILETISNQNGGQDCVRYKVRFDKLARKTPWEVLRGRPKKNPLITEELKLNPLITDENPRLWDENPLTPRTRNKEVPVETTSKSNHGAQIPEWVPFDPWNGFVEMRKQIRAPLTKYAITLAVKQLALLRTQGHEPTAVLEQSIANSWRGLFEVKSNGNGHKVNSSPTKRLNPARIREQQLNGHYDTDHV